LHRMIRFFKEHDGFCSIPEQPAGTGHPRLYQPPAAGIRIKARDNRLAARVLGNAAWTGSG
jgi:hypothetical protein